MPDTKHPSHLNMEELRALPPGPVEALCGAVSPSKTITIYIEEWMHGFCSSGTGLHITDGAVWSGTILLQPLDDLVESCMLVWDDSYGLRMRRCFVEVAGRSNGHDATGEWKKP